MVRTAQRPATPVEPYEFTIGVKLRPAIKPEDEGYEDLPAEEGAD